MRGGLLAVRIDLLENGKSHFFLSLWHYFSGKSSHWVQFRGARAGTYESLDGSVESRHSAGRGGRTNIAQRPTSAIATDSHPNTITTFCEQREEFALTPLSSSRSKRSPGLRS